MLRAISRSLDRIAIETACRSVSAPHGVVQSREIPARPDYFAELTGKTTLTFENGRFHYASPAPSAEPENNIVSGRFFPARNRRREEGRGPAVVLLHGWNGEQGYRFLFPLLARRFAALGITTAMIELPYHGSRKPRRGPLRNFLSGDIAHMMEATRQAVADIRAMIGWLRSESYGPVSLWGVSLGAWLGGLAAAREEDLGAVVLVTPVPRIDQAIENLEFCRHIRASMEARDLSPGELNMISHRPKLAPENILIVESRYDLFAPAASVEELWRAWGEPEIWRVKHGHISVLASVPIMDRTGRWLRDRMRANRARSLKSGV